MCYNWIMLHENLSHWLHFLLRRPKHSFEAPLVRHMLVYTLVSSHCILTELNKALAACLQAVPTTSGWRGRCSSLSRPSVFLFPFVRWLYFQSSSAGRLTCLKHAVYSLDSMRRGVRFFFIPCHIVYCWTENSGQILEYKFVWLCTGSSAWQCFLLIRHGLFWQQLEMKILKGQVQIWALAACLLPLVFKCLFLFKF